MAIKKFNEFIAEGLGNVRDKKVKHTEEIEIDDKSDKKTEKEVEEYLDDVAEECPRCGEHVDDCKCQEEDPWSTKVYHRVPVGKKEKSKPKQKFSNE